MHRLALTAPREVPLDVARWFAPADAADETVLARCRGPVLDVGCGPGRLVSALNQRGIAALGVDVAETAVTLTRGQGLPALLRSVFQDLPGEGRWPTVLLLDGNVGIGGDPRRLLERVRTLLRQGGQVIVETDADPAADDRRHLWFTEGGVPVTAPIEWASVGLQPLRAYARAAGYSVTEDWVVAGRTFAALTR